MANHEVFVLKAKLAERMDPKNSVPRLCWSGEKGVYVLSNSEVDEGCCSGTSLISVADVSKCSCKRKNPRPPGEGGNSIANSAC